MANFTKNAIRIKHQNNLLMNKMLQEKAEVTRENNQLNQAYKALNAYSTNYFQGFSFAKTII